MGSSSNNPIVKSVRSVLKKAKFRPRRWRRTMDLDQARKECQDMESDESKTHAMEETKEKQGLNQNSKDTSSVQPSGACSNPNEGACGSVVQNLSSNNQITDRCGPEAQIVLSNDINAVRILNEHQKRITRALITQVDYTNYLIPALTDIF